MLSGKLSTRLMEYILSADLEYFDNPSFHDKLTAAESDAHAISYITWNVLSGVSAAVSCLSVFAVIVQAQPLYGIAMLAASIPASIISARYAKLLYTLSLEQIHDLRLMGYCRSVATSRSHAQEMRLYGAGAKLVERYKRVWRRCAVVRVLYAIVQHLLSQHQVRPVSQTAIKHPHTTTPTSR